MGGTKGRLLGDDLPGELDDPLLDERPCRSPASPRGSCARASPARPARDTDAARWSLFDGGTTWSCGELSSSTGHAIDASVPAGPRWRRGGCAADAAACPRRPSPWTSGSAMSEPMPGKISVPSAMASSTTCAIGPVGSTAGFTQSDPGEVGVAGGEPGGERAAHRQPGDDDAAALAAGGPHLASAASASPDQSAHVVVSMSSIVVPCPGSRGHSTAKPAAASARPRPSSSRGCR